MSQHYTVQCQKLPWPAHGSNIMESFCSTRLRQCTEAMSSQHLLCVPPGSFLPSSETFVYEYCSLTPERADLRQVSGGKCPASSTNLHPKYLPAMQRQIHIHAPSSKLWSLSHRYRVQQGGGALQELYFSSRSAVIFWAVEKTLESLVDSKEIKPVNPKGNQPWTFIGSTDAEAPTLWPPNVKRQLTGKDPDARKDWGQKKGAIEDGMVDGITDLMGMSLSKAQEIANGREAWCAAVHGVTKSQTSMSEWTIGGWLSLISDIPLSFSFFFSS